jgi:hypothetical protein
VIDALLGPVSADDVDMAFAILDDDAKPPRVAAHLAVLNQQPAHVRLEIHLDLLAAIRTGHRERVVHRREL